MDWKLLLVGAVMAVAGGFLSWRYRASNYKTDFAPGCAMAFGLLLILTGVLAMVVGLILKG